MQIDTKELLNVVQNNIFKENLKSINNLVSSKDFVNNVRNEKIGLINEKDILNEVDDEFSLQIQERGKKCYADGNILQCHKSDNMYHARVRGTAEKPYIVHVEIKENAIEYNCNCPCNFPCKHEYAVLIAISNQEYKNVILKEKISERKDNLQSILSRIPADEIKEYLLSPTGMDYVCFEMSTFEEHFRKYYPKQSYEYYYNNLFNSISLNEDFHKSTNDYMNLVKQYISNYEFDEGFKIIKSIIESFNDTNILNSDDYIVDLFPSFGMSLRVIYRKASTSLKDEIVNWIRSVVKNNYYDNLYLEDIILMLK